MQTEDVDFLANSYIIMQTDDLEFTFRWNGLWT